MMITECAPLDALIQRFGRINRRRPVKGYRPVYVLSPPNTEKEVLPYRLETVQASYKVLPDGELLKERSLQELLDGVYPEIIFGDIDVGVCFKEKEWRIKTLRHYSKSALLETLDIDSVACITESEKEVYENSSFEKQMGLEIPVSYKSIGYNRLDQSGFGNRPFIVPDKAYSPEFGLIMKYVMPQYYDVTRKFL